MLPTDLLVPTDFSPTAERALDYAVELAAKLGARVHVLNVIAFPLLGYAELGVTIASETIDATMRDNQAALEALVATRRSRATFGEPMLRTGDAREVILTHAAEVHAELIVMGSHGRRGLSRLLLGSVAEAIVRTAPCPVLVVRAPDA